MLCSEGHVPANKRHIRQQLHVSANAEVRYGWHAPEPAACKDQMQQEQAWQSGGANTASGKWASSSRKNGGTPLPPLACDLPWSVRVLPEHLSEGGAHLEYVLEAFKVPVLVAPAGREQPSPGDKREEWKRRNGRGGMEEEEWKGSHKLSCKSFEPTVYLKSTGKQIAL